MVSVGNQSLDGKVSFVESRLASKLLKVSRKMLRRNVQRAVFWSNFLVRQSAQIDSKGFTCKYMVTQYAVRARTDTVISNVLGTQMH